MSTSCSWELWSTTASVVVTEAEALPAVVELVRARLDDIELACSRFRSDSEINRLTPGRNTVSPMLADLVAVALGAFRSTDGLVDPTVGEAVSSWGYDRTIEELPRDGAAVRVVGRVPGAEHVVLDGDVLDLPAGTRLDLGATAKAYAADLTSRLAADTVGVGVLVELGGDIATAGPPPAGGWQVLVDDHPDDPSCQVTLAAGAGIATSSTVRRTWRRGGVSLHHIVDPRTATPAEPVWRSVTVSAPTCVEANTASTAAVILGHGAPRWLAEHGLSARLVDARRRVRVVAGWPAEVAA